MRAQIDWLTLTPTAPQSQALRHFQRLQHSLFGKWRFARATHARTPMLALLRARFEDLKVGCCQASMSAHRGIRGADGSIDSMAVDALVQLTADMVMEVSVPEGLEWSTRGLTIEYLRSCDGTATALARLDKTDWGQPAQVGVPVTVTDEDGAEFARAVVSFAVLPRSD